MELEQITVYYLNGDAEDVFSLDFVESITSFSDGINIVYKDGQELFIPMTAIKKFRSTVKESPNIIGAV